jgi:excisionase family DNA binding protein
MVQARRLLSRREVAALFGVSPHTIYRWACEGRLPVVMTLGGRRRYPADDVARLVQAQTAAVRAAPKLTRGEKR